MNSAARTKPVMDVTLSQRPVSAPTSIAQAKASAAAAPATIALVRRKPLTPVLRTRIAKIAPAASRVPKQQPEQPAPTAKQPFASAARQVQRGAPVALITVTVFVILILSVLAVTLYVTSRVA